MALRTAVLIALSATLVVAATAEHGYGVGPGDVVRVEEFDHEEISGDFPVDEDGTMVFPLLGPVEVAGSTAAEISRRLERLLERDFYVDVQLHVEVVEFRSQPVTLMGEVGKPGTYYLRGQTSLTQLLAEAGGVRSTAGPELELRRLARNESGEEVQTSVRLSVAKVLTGEEGQELLLREGDVISVPARELYFVTGEVARPGQYEISRDMTLMQAISQAGGLSKFASQEVEVHRGAEEGKSVINADLAHIRKGRTADPEIRAGDVIIVRRRFF